MGIFLKGIVTDQIHSNRGENEMKFYLGIILSFAMCFPALGIEDSGPNCISLYFDESAEVYCLEGVEYQETVAMYIIFTNPTEENIFGFEFGYDMVGDAVVLSTVINDPSVDPGGEHNNLIIGFPSPHPTTQATLLAWQNLLYLDGSLGPVEFFTHGSTPSSLDSAYPTILFEGGELVLGNLLTNGSVAAKINGGCGVVSSESISFDNLKSLFR